MRSTALILTLAAACAALPAAAASPKEKAATAKAPPQLNVTGKWEAMQAGFYGQMRQIGNVIVGRCDLECAYEGKCDLPGIKRCYVRGAFLGDHVVFATFTTDDDTKFCLRSTFIAANAGKLSPLVGSWRGGWNYDQDGITRTSSDGGAWATFPYGDELGRCGDIVTYELSFDVGSAAIKNPDAPVLSAVAELLKAKPGTKLRIVGHTDSTGSAETNTKLSLDRAGSVKARLLELSQADPGRIAVEGMGPDQPLESNDTPAGRALNRRVEIVKGN